MSSDGSDFVVQIEVLPNQGLYPNGIRPGENDANMSLEIIQNESDGTSTAYYKPTLHINI